MDNPLAFHTPCNINLVAPTMSGKTQLVMNLLRQKEALFSPPPKKVLYAYAEWQDKFDWMQEVIPDIEFHQGLPSASFMDDWSSDNEPQALILDDLMTSIASSAEMVQLYTVKCHHRQITTMTLQHSLYPPGKHSKTLSLNVNYFVLFRNQRDLLQIQCFGRQCFPNNSKYFMDSYNKATSEPYGFLVVDLDPRSDKKYQLRSHILEGQTPVVYVPKL